MDSKKALVMMTQEIKEPMDVLLPCSLQHQPTLLLISQMQQKSLKIRFHVDIDL